MEHVDAPAPIVTPTPSFQNEEENYLHGTTYKVSYEKLWATVKKGVEAFEGNPYLYKDVITQCLFINEETGESLKFSRVANAPLFYIEDPSAYKDKITSIIEKIVYQVMPEGYNEDFKPAIVDSVEKATFTINFVPRESYMGALFSAENIYGLYITGEEEENIIQNGCIYVRDHNFIKYANHSLSEEEIWKIEEAVLCEEMTEAPINGQDNNIDPTMRFYNNPKIEDYLRAPDLTKKDFAVIEIALRLPPGVDKTQWKKFMNYYIENIE